jgi:subtilase-type serine protease
VYGQIEQACAGDKLLVFAAGNAGHPFPDIDQFSTKFGSHAAYNMLNVTAADNHSLTANSDGTISGQQALDLF